jgi:hypothetical protein
MVSRWLIVTLHIEAAGKNALSIAAGRRSIRMNVRRHIRRTIEETFIVFDERLSVRQPANDPFAYGRTQTRDGRSIHDDDFTASRKSSDHRPRYYKRFQGIADIHRMEIKGVSFTRAVFPLRGHPAGSFTIFFDYTIT